MSQQQQQGQQGQGQRRRRGGLRNHTTESPDAAGGKVATPTSAAIPWSASGSLFEELDKRVMVEVRDVSAKPRVKRMYGVLRSYDQFGTLVLEECVERVVVDSRYAEKRCGLCMIRGENVSLMGLVDPDVEAAALRDLTREDDFASVLQEEARLLEASARKLAATSGGLSALAFDDGFG